MVPPRIFDPALMTQHGYVERRHGQPSLRALARAMQVDVSTLVLVRQGRSQAGRKVIQGACRAYPGYALNFLFPDLAEAVPA